MSDEFIGDLTELTSVADEDILPIVDDPAGTPITKKVTAANLLAPHTAETAGAHDASAIAFTPAGTIAATDVQAAIEEVAAEAGGTHPDLATHDALGLATDAELATHVGAADPHTGYRKESDDHTHASTGAQGGQISHDVLTGVSADDHHNRSHAVLSSSDHPTSSIQVVTGSTALGSSASADQTITFGANFADTNYTVLVEFELSDAGANRNPPTYYVKTDGGKKAVGSCVIRILNNAAAALTWSWRAIIIHD